MDDSAPTSGSEAGSQELEGLGQLLSLKDGDTFLATDTHGDVLGRTEGFFDDDTRLLSRFRLLIGDKAPARLTSSVTRDNVQFIFHGTNRPLPHLGHKATPPGVLHIERRRFLLGRRMYERIR